MPAAFSACTKCITHTEAILHLNAVQKGPLSSLGDRPTDPECATIMASSRSALPAVAGAQHAARYTQEPCRCLAFSIYKQAAHTPHRGHTCRSSSALCAAPRAGTCPIKCWRLHAWAATAGHHAQNPMVHMPCPSAAPGGPAHSPKAELDLGNLSPGSGHDDGVEQDEAIAQVQGLGRPPHEQHVVQHLVVVPATPAARLHAAQSQKLTEQ